MNTIRFITGLSAGAVLAMTGCSESPSGESSAPDGITPDATDVSRDTTACTDERRFGDYKSPDDFCWAPPQQYCAQGAGWAETRACNADGTLCCEFSSTCIPCGWTNCNDTPNEVCALYPTDADSCASPDLQADLERIICFDGVL